MLLFVIAAAAAQPAADADCMSRILDYASWREAPGQQWDYRWSGGDRTSLVVIGAEHQRDPEHPQFQRIAAAFTEASPTLVFYEGPDRGVGEGAQDTIRSAGESGYARFLAAAHNVPARSLEPNPGQQIAMLLRAHPIDRVMLFFVLREAARLRNREQLSGQALDDAVSSLLGRMAPMGQRAGLTLPFTDVAGLQSAAARYWPGRDWRSLPGDWFSPLADDAQTGGVFIGAINRADSNNRNQHMVRQLVEAARSGERVFAVVGRNHVPMQAPALACALGGPTSRPR